MFWGKTSDSNEYSSCLTAGLHHHQHGLVFGPKQHCQVSSSTNQLCYLPALEIHQCFTFTKTIPQRC